MLYIFGGLPGSGKTTLARELARTERAVYLRLDTIEQALRDAVRELNGPEGYAVAYRVAADNLRLGLPVVADSVNPLPVTRAAWRAVAQAAGVPCSEIEAVCSDAAEHRQRASTRMVDIAGLRPPSWEEIISREYEPWEGAHIVLDTAGQSIAQSRAALHAARLAR